MIRQLLAVFLLATSAAAWSAQDDRVAVPSLTTRVTDLTQTLSADQRAALEQKLAAFEQQKGSQIAVLIVPTTQPEEIEQYSIRVVDAWKLGRTKVDDGALLIIAKNDRRLRIEVGRGLEGVLPDAIAKRIIAETITPSFKQGDFAGGINAGIDQMLSVIQGEALPPPVRGHGRAGDERLSMLFAPFIILFFLGNALRRATGTFPASGLVGAGMGVVGSFLLGSALLGVGLGLLAFIAALVMFSGSIGSGGYYGGGMGGGGFGGGGGFSGGGGGFSGGGSSGSW